MNLEVAGIEVKPAILAPLDPGFLPAALFSKKYRELVSASRGVPLRIALERGDGSISTFCTSVLPPSAGHAEAALLYAERFGDAAGRIPASFEILFLCGWAPHPNQPQSLRRGSATARLADALKPKG